MSTVYGQFAAYGLASDTPDHWDELALCKGENDLMWPLPNAVEQTALAVLKCNGCPVRVQCLLAGVDEDEFESVRGGLTGRQRKAAAKKYGRDLDAYPVPHSPLRWCQRCGDSFEVEVRNPHARLCAGCAAERDLKGKRRLARSEVRNV